MAITYNSVDIKGVAAEPIIEEILFEKLLRYLVNGILPEYYIIFCAILVPSVNRNIGKHGRTGDNKTLFV